MKGNVQVISTGYVPRPIQLDLHKKVKRFSVLVCHRRFGKTVWAVNELVDYGLRMAISHPLLPDPRLAYLAPFRGQAKDIAWDYLKRFTAALPGVDVNEAELRVEVPRPQFKDVIRWQLLGADNPMALKGRYLDYGVLDEYGEMYPAAWTEAIRPTLADRRGRAAFIGTPKGQNHFCQTYEYALQSGDKEWFGALYKASETGIIHPDELASLKRQMSEEEYDQEFECSFLAGLVGAYFGKEMGNAEKEGRITQVPLDPMLKVDTFWDLGINDVTSIWYIQKHFGTWRVVDYSEAPDMSLPEWVKHIKAKNYILGKAYVPHDAMVRELGTGKSRFEVLQGLLGRGTVKVVPRIEDKLDSINAARMMIPKCIFDVKRCERGLKALKNYQRKWDSKQQVFSPKPLHNFASNGSDAFQQFAMAAQEDRGDSMDGKPLPREYEDSGNLFTHMGGR